MSKEKLPITPDQIGFAMDNLGSELLQIKIRENGGGGEGYITYQINLDSGNIVFVESRDQ